MTTAFVEFVDVCYQPSLDDRRKTSTRPDVNQITVAFSTVAFNKKRHIRKRVPTLP
jgi:hypothetical protein